MVESRDDARDLRVVGLLKRHEHEDYYDIDTDFTPFSLKD